MRKCHASSAFMWFYMHARWICLIFLQLSGLIISKIIIQKMFFEKDRDIVQSHFVTFQIKKVLLCSQPNSKAKVDSQGLLQGCFSIPLVPMLNTKFYPSSSNLVNRQINECQEKRLPKVLLCPRLSSATPSTRYSINSGLQLDCRVDSWLNDFTFTVCAKWRLWLCVWMLSLYRH